MWITMENAILFAKFKFPQVFSNNWENNYDITIFYIKLFQRVSFNCTQIMSIESFQVAGKCYNLMLMQ